MNDLPVPVGWIIAALPVDESIATAALYACWLCANSSIAILIASVQQQRPQVVESVPKNGCSKAFLPIFLTLIPSIFAFRKVSTFAKSERKCPKRRKKAAFLILSYLKDGFDTLFDCGENADKF